MLITIKILLLDFIHNFQTIFLINYYFITYILLITNALIVLFKVDQIIKHLFQDDWITFYFGS